MSIQPSPTRSGASRVRFGGSQRASRTASAGLVVAALWSVVGPWFLFYPFTADGNDKILRAFVLAVVVGYSGFYLFYVGKSRVPSFVSAIGGVLLLISVVADPPTVARITVNEIITAGMIVLFAVMSMNPEPAHGSEPAV